MTRRSGIVQYYVPVLVPLERLFKLLNIYEAIQISQLVIFCSSEDKCVSLCAALEKKGIKSATLLENEEQTIQEFLDHGIHALVISDKWPEGLPLGKVPLVVNFDFPEDGRRYASQIGGVGGSRRRAIVINFVTEAQLPLLNKVELECGTKIPRLPNDASLVLKSMHEASTL